MKRTTEDQWLSELSSALSSRQPQEKITDYTDESIRWAIDSGLTPDQFLEMATQKEEPNYEEEDEIPPEGFDAWVNELESFLHRTYGDHIDADTIRYGLLREGFARNMAPQDFYRWVQSEPEVAIELSDAKSARSDRNLNPIALGLGGAVVGFVVSYVARQGMLQMATFSEWVNILLGTLDPAGNMLLRGVRETIISFTVGGGIVGVIITAVVNGMRR